MPMLPLTLRHWRLALSVVGSLATLFSTAAAQTTSTVVALQTLYTFHGSGDGSSPSGGLTAGGDGFLYGTTTAGGIGGSTGGTLFRLASDGTLTTLSSFVEGSPASAPAVAPNGVLYGTAPLGGQNSAGFVFRTSPDGSTRIVGSFAGTTTGTSPYASLLQSNDGSLYGTTTKGTGDALNGGVFALQTDGSLRVLHLFKADGSEGTLPYGALIQSVGSDDAYYGTTSANGPKGGGTVFRVSVLGVLQTVYAFSGGADGSSPRAALVLGGDGNLYGTTANGGSAKGGTVFRLTPQGTLTTLHSFDANAGEGIFPAGPLVDGGDGFFYGTTTTGGASNAGTIYAVSTAGTFQTVYSFTGGKDGAGPTGTLVSGGNGIFYGTTGAGGLNNGSRGTAFLLNLRAQPDVPGTLAFSAASVGVSESAGVVTLTVDRTGGATGSVSVGYTTVDGTAKAGTDFLATSGKIGWADGDDAPKKVTIPISDTGTTDGSTRTFSVRLLAAVGGATVGDPTSEAVNILEDDAVQPTTVTLSVLGDGRAVVGGENGKVLFTRSGDTTAALSVAYQLKGAPINGTDYQFLPGKLTIPAGASSAKLKIKPRSGAGRRGTSNIRIIPVAPTDGSYVVEPAKVKIQFVHD